MSELTKDEIRLQLAEHHLWLIDNTQGKCIDWSGKDLRETDLSGAVLNRANLCRTNLVRANLSDYYWT